MKRDWFVLMVALIGAVVFGWLYHINADINKNSARITVIEELYKRSDDRWRGEDMQKWCVELKRLNPTLKLPVDDAK